MLRPTVQKEKRRYSRFPLDLPLEYQVMDFPEAHGAIAVNGSVRGLLIHSLVDMPVRARLKVTVLFVNGFQLGHFEAMAEVVRKDRRKEKWEKGYEYGLSLIEIKEDDRSKLKELLATFEVGPGYHSGGISEQQGWRSSV